MFKNIKPFTKWLCACFLFIAILLGARIWHAGNIRYLFLVWNLFLAWIPFAISLSFKNMQAKPTIIQIVIFTIWILFFPNALYIVTDIIHIANTTAVPIWYDAILLFTSSFAGLVLAFASIKNIEGYLKNIFRKKYVSPIIVLLIFAGSFGVYLGRFQRWNSWDIIHNPLSLALDIMSRFTSPFAHTKTWAVTFILTGLYTLCWFLIKSFPMLSYNSSNKSEVK
jgi:uncharacterized membrane protein